MSKLFHDLEYFTCSKDGICAEDFKRKLSVVTLNTSMVSELSDVRTFKKPFSGDEVGKYAWVTMKNSDTYYFPAAEHPSLYNALHNLKITE